MAELENASLHDYSHWDRVAREIRDGPDDDDETAEPVVEDVTDMLSTCDSTYSRRSIRRKKRKERQLERLKEEAEEGYSKCLFCNEVSDAAGPCDAFCGACPAQERASAWAHVSCLRARREPWEFKYGSADENTHATSKAVLWTCPRCRRNRAELDTIHRDRERSLRTDRSRDWVPQRLPPGAGADDAAVTYEYREPKWDDALEAEAAELNDRERDALHNKGVEEEAERIRREGRPQLDKKEMVAAWKKKIQDDEDRKNFGRETAPDTSAQTGRTAALGATVRVEGLVATPRYNGLKGVLVAEKVADEFRVAVQLLLDDGGFGGILMLRRTNIMALPLEPRVAHARLLEDRAYRLYEDPKTGGVLWVGDCLAAAVATREGATKMDRRSVHNMPRTIRDSFPWARCAKVVCCAKELCRDKVNADRAEAKLRDHLGEKPGPRWTRALAFCDTALDRGESVLAFCVDGANRSAALGLAVMVRRGVPLADAWDALLAAKDAAPNLALVVALLALEKDKAGATTLRTGWADADLDKYRAKYADDETTDLLETMLGAQE